MKNWLGIPPALPKRTHVFFQTVNVIGGALFVLWLALQAHKAGIF